ncbi:hypothetical protein A3Q56_04065 [Intoshia linei]|uniref:CCHC-type domain-containing protein n=1 Tax=Intoshia linei TaxID=1819745 RepID=A0A177B1Q2_9BILA|nr:hypothetical protein A3Q56_04065 [Intoshia linei]
MLKVKAKFSKHLPVEYWKTSNVKDIINLNCNKPGHMAHNCYSRSANKDVKPKIRKISINPYSEINAEMELFYDKKNRLGKLSKSDVILRSSDNSIMKVHGKVELICGTKKTIFYITHTVNIRHTGCRESLGYGIITVNVNTVNKNIQYCSNEFKHI